MQFKKACMQVTLCVCLGVGVGVGGAAFTGKAILSWAFASSLKHLLFSNDRLQGVNSVMVYR